MHGTFWRFPATFGRASSAGIAPALELPQGHRRLLPLGRPRRSRLRRLGQGGVPQHPPLQGRARRPPPVELQPLVRGARPARRARARHRPGLHLVAGRGQGGHPQRPLPLLRVRPPAAPPRPRRAGAGRLHPRDRPRGQRHLGGAPHHRDRPPAPPRAPSSPPTRPPPGSGSRPTAIVPA